MFFEASPDFITTLDSVTLVRLMKRLMLAECRLAGVPLRAATAPLQVTVADGGEDGRAEWAGGIESTPYFPSRFCVFQSKAQNLTESSIRSEVLKFTRNKPARLNEAISEVLSRGGAYIVFCSNAFTGKKKGKLVNAIRAAIREGRGKPANASAIEVYDANQIADWVNTHSSVALWLAALQRGRSLAGFLSHDSWGKMPDISGVPWVTSEIPRYSPINRVILPAERKAPELNAWTFDQAKKNCLDSLDEDHAVIRITGPSGFGKSRSIYEMFRIGPSFSSEAENASIIYADYSVVGDEVLKLALEIANSGSTIILIVDECSDPIHLKLAAFAGRDGSRLRIVTMDVETRVIQAKNTLVVHLEKADDVTIIAIANGIASKLTESDTRFIAQLSNGYPSMAVLAAQENGDVRLTISSAEQVLDRVIWGQRAKHDEAQRALECLSLFDWVGFSGERIEQAAFIATELVGISIEKFVEHVLSFDARGILTRRGDFIQIGPIPLAARLGVHRLSLLNTETLTKFFQNAPNGLKGSLLKRMRWLDTSPTAITFAQALLRKEGIGNLAALNTEFGAKCIDQLVHVDADAVMITIDQVFGALTFDELRALKEGRSYLVWALTKLVFREKSFDRAARLLRKLAVAENEDRYSNNATGQFKQLFQLHLCGTEATPAARLLVLDEGLASDNAAEQELCVDSLDNMLLTHHFTRSGGADEIGSAQKLKDWSPKTYGEMWDFHRSGLTRLTNIALGGGPYAKKAKKYLGNHIRGLIGGMPFDDVRTMIDRIVGYSGIWPDAIEQITAWLYFDGNKALPEITKAVREYFDQLMPNDPVEQAIIYTNGWSSSLHDPDSRYNAAPDAVHDFDYSTRKSVALASIIAADSSMTKRSMESMAWGESNGIFAFARQLAISVLDPLSLFKLAIASAELSNASANRQFFGGLIAGADSRDPEVARACIRAALQSTKLKDNAISLVGSGKLRPDDLKIVVSLLRAKDVEPWQCIALSNGKGMDHLSVREISPLLKELMIHPTGGCWAVLDIVSMYLHGGKKPNTELVSILKKVLLAPQLFHSAVRGTMDGYHFEQTVGLLARHGSINKVFVKALMKQLIGLCQIQQSDVFFALDDYARNAIRLLIVSYPDEVWGEISKKLLSKDWRLTHRLDKLLKFEREDYLGAGPLYDLPANIYIDWVRGDATKRAAVVVKWLPIAMKQPHGGLSWHPAIESFILNFGHHPKVLGELSLRMHPRSWWGSLAPHLEPFLPLLAQWQQHPIKEVKQWANSQIIYRQAEIEQEKKRSEEDDVDNS
jgi:hypothetical protein